MRTADRLGRLSLFEVRSGKDVELGTLWKDRRAVLIFLRHFG